LYGKQNQLFLLKTVLDSRISEEEKLDHLSTFETSVASSAGLAGNVSLTSACLSFPCAVPAQPLNEDPNYSNWPWRPILVATVLNLTVHEVHPYGPFT